jgi:hypothetical protein
LAVTARHVVAGIIGVEDVFKWGTVTAPQMAVSVWSIDQQRSADWRVSSISGCPFTDVAYLHLTTDDPDWRGVDHPTTVIDLDFPDLDDTLVAYGFPQSSVDLAKVGDAVTLTLKYEARRATGRVIEMHPYRDSSMYPFPVLRTDATFDAGMSGGPVFDAHGRLRGLICGGTNGLPDVNYAALLWPSVFTHIASSLRGEPPQLRTIHDLAQARLLSIHGLEHVQLVARNSVKWVFPRETRMRGQE